MRKTRKNKRDDILQATADLVCEHGFSNTSINMVCERVGVAKTAIYWHFGNRDGLMHAVIDELTHDFIAQVRSNVFLKGTPLERRDQMIAGMRDIVENQTERFRVLIIASIESAEIDPHFQTACLRLTDATTQAIADGYRATLGFDLPDMDLLGHTLIALMVEALRRKKMDPEGCNLDRLFEDFERLVELMVRDRIRRFNKSQEAETKA